MNQSFYIGAVGAHQQLRRLNIQGDNIANVNTFGFKADKARFTALMYQNMQGIEREVSAGVGTRLLMTSTDFRQGPSENTGRKQDYMIDGDGFFALVDLSTGDVTFTRNGAFTMAELLEPGQDLDENGEPIIESVFYLSDGEGRFVLSREGGLIRVTDPEAEYPVGIFDYSNYDGMGQLTNSRYLPVDKNGNLWIGSGKLRQGLLEGSNTDLAEELTKVIESQRAYGLALKIVQTSDEIETTINGLRS
ncbi:flagellar hook-basal body protein [Pseudoflavonifractor sp. 524-17]|uniref:flagellar hook-basal body protein n=1 Tax=Pseudoflavonifractor sp. 524-17 TaxID=2304577 RepID=UPI001379BE26|nr:flagellar hook-basal body protein [Pseudoflavonifractor sp. 524-17]NCE65529.1 flagellar hook-basal body protein [Pseudoflavonifractor sp. 524-17]